MKYRWHFDAERQVLITEAGHPIAVREIAQWLQDRVHSRHNLDGPWKGWRIRGATFSAPNGMKFTPQSLRKSEEGLRVGDENTSP